jgi:pimeloyl-ACP methyl ester carboxylesterase
LIRADREDRVKMVKRIPMGEKDIIQPEHTKQIAAHIPNSTLLKVPKETHYYPSENPVSFNKTVQDFLKNK